MRKDKTEKLHKAVPFGDYKAVKKNLTKENVNSLLDGYSPLHWAVQEGFTKIVELLIEFGADLNIKDDSGFSPLHKAVGENRPELARLLLDLHADVDALDGDTQSSPLSIACAYGLEPIVTLLLEYNAKVNLLDIDGNPPITYAVINGYFGIVEKMIAAGAKTNILVKDVDVSEDELKLLEVAQNHNHKAICKILTDL